MTRETPFAEAMALIQETTVGIEHPRARRLAQREATLDAMAPFGLINVTVGGRMTMALKADNIS